MSGGSGWRRLTIVRRIPETDDIVSLRLAAADGAPLAPFRPGQFLTFRFTDGDGRPTPRSYSLSSDPADLAQYRITVRRHDRGFGSRLLHDTAEGALLEASEPKGRFVLDESSERPVILLAGGIGVTPLIAMAQSLARTKRSAVLIHACRNEAARPFAGELRGLEGRASNVRIAPVLTKAEGRIDADALRRLLPIGDYEAYLCGPPGFMQAMLDLLVGLGVREERIACEFFGPARKLAAGGSSAAPAPAAPAEDGGIVVAFSRSGRSARWDGAHRTLLDFAEAQGLTPAFSCRNGVCSTCLCGVQGEVRYVEEPLDEPGPGKALLCCSIPVGSLTIDI